MNNEFEWTDDNVKELLEKAVNAKVDNDSITKMTEQFKASKQVKDWEVVEFKYPHENGVYVFKDSGKWISSNIILKEFDYEELIRDFAIHSVKRLSDGEVFSVGEDTNWGQIKGFEVKDGGIRVLYYAAAGNWQWLSSIRKKRTPLFTTEDGKEVFEGDSYFPLYKDFTIGKFVGGSHAQSIEIKYFSTREVAETYVEHNKPCLSKNDVISWVEGVIHSKMNNEAYHAALNELVKSKL